MKKITIENMDGTMEEVDLINSFDVKDINKNFVILSKWQPIQFPRCLLPCHFRIFRKIKLKKEQPDGCHRIDNHIGVQGLADNIAIVSFPMEHSLRAS